MNYWVWNNHAFQYVTILTLETSIKIIRILIIDFNIHGIYHVVKSIIGCLLM